jgi:phenylacetate-coenzyme A ligase PaaK-like adenylate-forming protein
VLITYPSYLGELFECGQRLGYRPQDFGLRQVMLGGEIVTEGLKRRAQSLFGPVSFREGYAMTETWPLEGKLCEQGHLHFEPPQGLVEVVDLETHRPALPGHIGVLVATPFPPFRETTLLLRYETQDMVRLPVSPLGCSLADRPATGHLLGKLKLSVPVSGGWVTPRPILEALEGIEEIPLPARFRFRRQQDGIRLTVLVTEDMPETRHAIETAIEENGVPLQELKLVENRGDLQGAYPLRCDLREATFTQDSLPEEKVGA